MNEYWRFTSARDDPARGPEGFPSRLLVIGPTYRQSRRCRIEAIVPV